MPFPYHYAVPPLADEPAKEPPLRIFTIKFRLEGELRIQATDADSAEYLAQTKTARELGEIAERQGGLEMDDPEDMGVVQ